jgi:hypothetical protein
MAKHRRTWNEFVYQKYIREGRGQGSGVEYMPWIFVCNFPSRGMASRVKGTKTDRIHHLMSNNELNFFYLLDWSDNVLDIREQFPLLDLRRTIEIAENAQIRYPYDNKSGFPHVLTSDFFIETVRGLEVITIKESQDLEKRRVREKLEIERRYWSEKNIRWKIVTEKEINRTKAKNIEWLSQAKDLDCFCISEQLQAVSLDYFIAQFSTRKCSINELLCEIESEFTLEPGMGLNIYKHLAYWKQIQVDISNPIDFSNLRGQDAVLTA